MVSWTRNLHTYGQTESLPSDLTCTQSEIKESRQRLLWPRLTVSVRTAVWSPGVARARAPVQLSRSGKGRMLLKSSSHSPCGEKGAGRRPEPPVGASSQQGHSPHHAAMRNPACWQVEQQGTDLARHRGCNPQRGWPGGRSYT